MPETDIMTLREVALYLKIKERTVYHLVSKGRMPGFKVGGAWRFRKSRIDEWIEENQVGADPTKTSKGPE